MAGDTGLRVNEADIDDDSSTSASRALPVTPYAPAMLSVVLGYWTVEIVAPALPAIRDHFGLSAAGAGLVLSFMFLGRLAGNVPATWMLGRFGAPHIALIGAIVLTLGSVLVAGAPGAAWLYVGRIVQGIGVSLIANASLRSILKLRPAEGAAMTWFGIGAMVGGVLGLSASGVLTDQTGWRAVFGLSAGLATAIAAVSALSLVGTAGRRHPDALGSRESTESLPGRRPNLRSLAAPLAINLTVFVNYSIWVVLPLYVQHEFGASAERVATLLMIITAVHLIASLPVAAVIRRRGSQVVVAGGMAASLLGILLVPQMPGLLWLIVPLTLYGVGQVAAVNAGGDIILRRGEGTSTAVGLVRLSSDFGLVLGPVIAGALADWLGYRAPFYALSLTLAVAIVVALTRIREPTRTVSKRVRWTKGVH